MTSDEPVDARKATKAPIIIAIHFKQPHGADDVIETYNATEVSMEPNGEIIVKATA